MFRLLCCLVLTKAYSSRNPVVLIPGIAGSGLFANIKIPSCAQTWFRIWASLSPMLPPKSHQECWIQAMRLQINQTDINGMDIWSNVYGVETKVDPGLHGIDYLEYIEGYGVAPVRYFHDIIAELKLNGYLESSDLIGFPYDWRYPVWQIEWGNFKDDVESLRKMNGQRVVIVAHSMGNNPYLIDIFLKAR